MRISFVCPSSRIPTGGVTTMYEFANGLARRGHHLRIAHGGFWGREGLTSLDELDWFSFHPDIEHFFGGPGEAIELPDGDIIFGTGAERRLGEPVLLVQGVDMFPREMEREIFRTPCLKVCIASWLVAEGARFGVPARQLVHVPQGIDHGLYRPRTPPADRGPVVGILHHDHPAKGWATGLEALELARRSVPELRVVAFGTKAPDEELPEWVELHVGLDPPSVVDVVYDRCRVFVQPSVFEGFGFTAVEAMACGCALVTTDNGGSADYAVEGETAVVVPPGDATGLAEGVVRLLGDDDLRLRLAAAGERWVRRFDWDRAAALLERSLEAYLEDPAAYQEPPSDLGAEPT
jgi:glycosyltransferase involved in cell wall biosynthesis